MVLGMRYILNLSLTFQPAVKQTDPGTKYHVLHTFAIRKHFSVLETVGRAARFSPKFVRPTIKSLNITHF